MNVLAYSAPNFFTKNKVLLSGRLLLYFKSSQNINTLAYFAAPSVTEKKGFIRLEKKKIFKKCVIKRHLSIENFLDWSFF